MQPHVALLKSIAVRKKSITSCYSVWPSFSLLRFVAAVSCVIERYGGSFLPFLPPFFDTIIGSS